MQGLGLVCVAVYQRALKLLYVDELLEAVKQEFATTQYKAKQYDYPKFEASFKRMLAEAEARADAAVKDRASARSMQGKKVRNRAGFLAFGYKSWGSIKSKRWDRGKS